MKNIKINEENLFSLTEKNNNEKFLNVLDSMYEKNIKTELIDIDEWILQDEMLNHRETTYKIYIHKTGEVCYCFIYSWKPLNEENNKLVKFSYDSSFKEIKEKLTDFWK